MPYRRMNTARWGEGWFEGFTAPEKLIYWYLESNDRCPACGIYQVTLKRIAQETDLPLSQVEKAVCHGLQPWILYDRRTNLIFIRRFVKDQRSSANWMISVERALNELEPHSFIKEFLQENHIFKIGYRKAMDSVSIATDTISDSLSLDLLGDGSKEGGDSEPPPRDPRPLAAGPSEEQEPQPEKQKYEDHVYMTEKEYNNLCKGNGKARVNLEILNLDSYLANNKAKREGKYAYTDHAKVIGTWIRNDEKGKGGTHEKGKAKGEPDYSRARARHGGS